MSTQDLTSKALLMNARFSIVSHYRSRNAGFVFAIPLYMRMISVKGDAKISHLNQGNFLKLNMETFAALPADLASSYKGGLLDVPQKLYNFVYFLGLIEDDLQDRQNTILVLETLRSLAVARDISLFGNFVNSNLSAVFSEIDAVRIEYKPKKPGERFDSIKSLSLIPPEVLSTLEGVGDFSGFDEVIEERNKTVMSVLTSEKSDLPARARAMLTINLPQTDSGKPETVASAPKPQPAPQAPATKPAPAEVAEDDAWARTTATPLRSHPNIYIAESAKPITLPPMDFTPLAEVKLPLHDVEAMSEAEHEQYAYEMSLQNTAAGLMDLI